MYLMTKNNVQDYLQAKYVHTVHQLSSTTQSCLFSNMAFSRASSSPASPASSILWLQVLHPLCYGIPALPLLCYGYRLCLLYIIATSPAYLMLRIPPMPLLCHSFQPCLFSPTASTLAFSQLWLPALRLLWYS
jgi:hypothetical protein